MSLLHIARPGGKHRSASRPQIAADLDACRRQKDAATIAAIRYATDAKELQQQLDTAGIELSGVRLDLEEAQREITRLTAALANATSVSDLGQHPAVTETQPIPVLPLHQSPLANPAHIPTEVKS
ncbi:hypothetical protein ACLF6K_37185 [Streptomyces xanthophaeus]|uniref:hypothetical protein n=1 Tax=Streptomyces xanthophaeus TaxID=67385 RepID=UPI00398FA402